MYQYPVPTVKFGFIASPFYRTLSLTSGEKTYIDHCAWPSSADREPWLDEGLARFNEVRYYEAFVPREVAWWWQTVIGTPRPSDPLDSPSAAFTNHGDYLDNIYDQGARYLDTLRMQLGPETFNAFLRDLYRQSMFQVITTEDFFEVLSAHTRLSQRTLKGRFFR